MKELFYMGGPLFMGILTALLIILLAVTVYFAVSIASGRASGKVNFRHQLTYLKSIGLFIMITGILGQLIGLMDAFKAIERVGDISPTIMAGGLKISMITTLYGILIYLFSILVWFLLDLWHHSRSTSEVNG
jgi:hypothetical protein